MNLTNLIKKHIIDRYDLHRGFNKPLSILISLHTSTHILEELGVHSVLEEKYPGYYSNNFRVIYNDSNLFVRIPEEKDLGAFPFARALLSLKRISSGEWKFYIDNTAKELFTPDEIREGYSKCVEIISAAIKDERAKEISKQQRKQNRENAWCLFDKS